MGCDELEQEQAVFLSQGLHVEERAVDVFAGRIKGATGRARPPQVQRPPSVLGSGDQVDADLPHRGLEGILGENAACTLSAPDLLGEPVAMEAWKCLSVFVGLPTLGTVDLCVN